MVHATTGVTWVTRALQRTQSSIGENLAQSWLSLGKVSREETQKPTKQERLKEVSKFPAKKQCAHNSSSEREHGLFWGLAGCLL